MTTSDNTSARPAASAPVMPGRISGGMSMAIGSLPYLDVGDAVAAALAATDIVTIPTTPRRSPAEGMLAQALIGIQGVSISALGTILVDPLKVTAGAAVTTDLGHDAFATMRAFLDAGPQFSGPVKWQFVGPVTLGLALQRAGVRASVAFEVAAHAVRSHVEHLLTAVAAALPGS
ncbi:MAG TPA: hypothetical protein PLV68_10330, partial [Ilumatobacteraceae bacterium]|nr:hypothetical protein [Ilumatobacteraceae bacterium]